MSRSLNRRRFVLLLVVSAMILVVGLVAVELVFGSWLSKAKIARLHIPRNVRLVFESKDGAPKPLVYTRDRYGFRGSYGDVSRIDILTIGGSTTDQRGISDGETWQDVLTESFAAAGRPMTVVNAGVDGQSTAGMIKNFDWWFPAVPNLKARYCLAYVGVNDFMIENSEEYDELIDEKLRQEHPLRMWVKDNSAVYDLFRTLRGMRRASGRLVLKHAIDWSKVEWTHEALQNDNADWMKPRIESYEKRLRLLVAKIRAFGAEPILVTQRWSRYRFEKSQLLGVTSTWNYAGRPINGVDHYHMMKLFNSVTLAVAKDEGVRSIDLAEEIQMVPTDFTDPCHTTSVGARKIGEYLYSKLRDLP